MQDVEMLIDLRKILQERFSLSELKTLAFDSGLIDYENLPIVNKSDFSRELILHHLRRNSLIKLIAVGKNQRPDINWEFVNLTPTDSKDVLYDSRAEEPAFDSWTYYFYSSPLSISRLVKIKFVHPDGFAAFEMSCLRSEHVGVNKSIRTLYGTVSFEYQVLYSDSDSSNILFCMIPMQEPGIGRTGLIEIGTNTQGDPKNPFSPYRERYFVPRNHFGDNRWHKVTMPFDFRPIDSAYYSIFGPRINEGCEDTGIGHLFISNVQIFLQDF